MTHAHMRLLSSYVSAYRKRFVDGFFVSLSISMGVGYLQWRGYFDPAAWYLSSVPGLIYMFAAGAVMGIQYLRIRGANRGIIVTSMTAQWTILDAKGNIASDLKYDIVNSADVPVAEFVPDREGFHSDVMYNPEYVVFPGPRRVAIRAIKRYEVKLAFHSRQVPAIQHEANLEFDPPIKPGERIALIRRYDARRSELAAFTSAGTFFGMRIFHPTAAILMHMIAPPHYRAEVLNYYVGNEDGEVLDCERRRQAPPRRIADGRVIEWRIVYPRNHYRYWVNYRLCSLL